MRSKVLGAVALWAAILTFSVVTADAADFITGFGWITTEAIASSGTGASAASLGLGTCHNGAGACTFANADVTFTTTGVNFNTTSSTLAAWLASNPFPLNNLVDTAPGNLMDASIWEFVGNVSVTGTVATPQTFSVQHDDGATFIVNGQTVINAPGPTPPIVTTGSYTGGVNGNAAFSLFYTECCGGPAVLNIGLLAPVNAPAVPEPGSLALVGTGLAGLAAGVLRRRKLAK
jgi:PEP-CTERM motif-containing protein